MISRFFAVLSLSSFAVAACTETPNTDRIVAIPEQVQVQAHAACQAEQGLVNGAAIEILELSNETVLATTLNGNGVTSSQARAVNQCARAKLLNGQAGAVASVQSRPDVAPQKTNTGQLGCVKGMGVLQGGLRVCPGY